MLKAMAERPSLSRCALEQHHRLAARPRLARHTNGVRDEAQCLVIRSCRACTWMNHDAEQSQRFGAVEFVHKGGDGLLAQDRKGGREVDEITGVRYDRRDLRLL